MSTVEPSLVNRSNYTERNEPSQIAYVLRCKVIIMLIATVRYLIYVKMVPIGTMRVANVKLVLVDRISLRFCMCLRFCGQFVSSSTIQMSGIR